MSTRNMKKTNPCAHCSGNCTKCNVQQPASLNKFETLVHKILKTTPLGCKGESWQCFLKSKHMLMYGASAFVFFVLGNTTNALFEKKIQDWFFPDKTPEVLEPPKSAYHPKTGAYFKIKAIIRNMETGEKTAVLEESEPATLPSGYPLTPQTQNAGASKTVPSFNPPQKISFQRLEITPRTEETRSL